VLLRHHFARQHADSGKHERSSRELTRARLHALHAVRIRERALKMELVSYGLSSGPPKLALGGAGAIHRPVAGGAVARAQRGWARVDGLLGVC